MTQVLWYIAMLGRHEVRHGTQTLDRFRTRKTGSLLFYLAFHLSQSHSRETLAESLWPETPIESARNNLSVSLSALRRALEPDTDAPKRVLWSDRDTIALNPRCVRTDVLEFEEARQAALVAADQDLQERLLTAAIERYSGDLLPNHYEAWVLTERDRLRDAYLDLISRLVRLLAECRDYGRALEYAHRAVQVDPTREAARRDLMRLLAATGRSEAALQQYDQLMRLLREQFHTAPSSATQKLAMQLRARSVSPPEQAHTNPPVSSLSSTLPNFYTQFFGRREELDTIQRALASSGMPPAPHLVTLTGMGGAGKTRLAIEAGRRLHEAYQGQVRFVALAELTEAARLPQYVAVELGLPSLPEISPLEQIVNVLGANRTLLILDNFEQLLPKGADFILELRRRLPGLSLLVTSRTRLGLTGEVEIVTAPFPVPTLVDTPDRLMEFASVQLFVSRAQERMPEFTLNSENAEAITALCTRLEGVPLALELAAGWIRTLTPDQILARVQRSYNLLPSRYTDLPERHRTLYSAIDGSYQLLAPDQSRFFARLSVFQGGWCAEGAAAIAIFEEERDQDEKERLCLEWLAHLQDMSLVVAEEVEQGEHRVTRFRFLEMIREFASLHLDPGERRILVERHADFFVRLAQDAEQGLHTERVLDWLDRLDSERENLGQVLRRSLEETEEPDGIRLPAERGARLATSLAVFWSTHTNHQEHERWIRAALSKVASCPRDLQAKVLFSADVGGFTPPQDALKQALQIYTEVGDQAGWCCAQGRLLRAGVYTVEEATALWEEVFAISAGLEVTWIRAQMCSDKGYWVYSSTRKGDWSLFEEGVAICRQYGDAYILTGILNDFAYCLLADRQHERALSLIEQSVALCRRMKHRGGQAHALWLLGKAVAETDPDRAEGYFREGLALQVARGLRPEQSDIFYELGSIAMQREDYAQAQSINERIVAFIEDDNSRKLLEYGLPAAGMAALANGDFTASRLHFMRIFNIGKSQVDRIRETYAIRFLTLTAFRQGDREQALPLLAELLNREKVGEEHPNTMAHYVWILEAMQADRSAVMLLGAAMRRWKERGTFQYFLERRETERISALLLERLGQSEFAEALEAGQRLEDAQISAMFMQILGR